MKKRDLMLYAVECYEEICSAGIVTGKIIDITENNRAKERWGQCVRLPGGSYKININSYLLTENSSEKGLKETIIHEMLHTVPDCYNHGTDIIYNVQRQRRKKVQTGTKKQRKRRQNTFSNAKNADKS